MVEWCMAHTMTLNDYRQAITHAKDGQDLALLLYRALPVACADLGIPFEPHGHLQVETKLTRMEHQWHLWFNIHAPEAIRVLTHLDGTIFQHMSGGRNQASAIVKHDYSVGFSQQVTEFHPENIFQQQEQASKKRLNAADSLEQWWDEMHNTFSLALTKSRGWVDPNEAQRQYIAKMADAFRQAHGTTISNLMLSRGNVTGTKRENANVYFEWSSFSTQFNYGFERQYLPLVSHHPWLKVDASSMHAFKLTGLRSNELTKGLEERGKPIVAAYCMFVDTAYMPAYMLTEQLKKPPVKNVNLQLPELGPAPF